MSFYCVGQIFSRIATRNICQLNSEDGKEGKVMTFRSAAIDVAGIIIYPLAMGLYRAYGVDTSLKIALLFSVVPLLLKLKETNNSLVEARGNV